MITNDPPQTRFFYIGARNFFEAKLSPLYRVKYKCPVGAATLNPNGTPTTTAWKYICQMNTNGGKCDVNWNQWLETETIAGCGFWKYEIEVPTTPTDYTSLVSYTYDATTCDYKLGSCNVAKVVNTAEMQLHFFVKAWPFHAGTVSSNQRYDVIITPCSPSTTYSWTVNPLPTITLDKSPIAANTVNYIIKD